MRKLFNKFKKSTTKEAKAHPVIYICLFLVLLIALFVRVYRTEALLGFYYDQGRDAMVIWRLWQDHKFFMIGPVTGLAGIFLGPFYYYLIAPFYLISGGDPVLPAVFLAFLSTIAIYFLYLLGKEFQDRITGLIAAVIAGFSYYIVLAGRWLSNPTPILLTSVLLLLSMWKIVKGESKKWWIAIALLIGISLHFEAASAVFYLPMILVFAVWQKKNFPDKKVFLISSAAFIGTLFPQIFFNFRHENILFNGFKETFVEQESFKLSFQQVLGTRLNYFWAVFHSKILPGLETWVLVISAIVLGISIERKKEFNRNALTLLAIFIGIPMLGFIFFQGNSGNIYDYYMTGYYLPIILLFSMGLAKLLKTNLGKLIILIFFFLFFTRNGEFVKNHIAAGFDGPTHITLGNELQAVDWIFEDAKGKGQFNVDVYVPPVIPHSYDYLFLWQATKRCGDSLCEMNLVEQVSLLYTLYEEDPPHPERLEAWLARQKGIGEVEEESSFGGITVQRRKRL
ncbi:glycosyltransferase family 39 protein [Patescibacteria group bacterium]|nr:glycosyltransferase family 39 protein [Patescibacteria group bacterium]MBU0776928.1 glycosyltransferase family 39 protein [Patescibacteria group bacterium]MBU0845956.1 glycosyltransferase family 39 protein [Patescibacteria group bacterium]MBU0922507.1 glycosyltransferase family 39 protein [Patescibacteria group bacterium]MBU1066315.1 glycosyltransferase family 39 protein [Patescibacteria group bacterium]